MPSGLKRFVLVLSLLLGAQEASQALVQVESGPPPGGEISKPDPKDLTSWHWWWHFNKDAYLRLREQVFESSPVTGGTNFWLGLGERQVERNIRTISDYELRYKIVPALIEAMDDEESSSFDTACMMALAKIGERGEVVGGGDPMEGYILPFLKDSNQDARWQATIALGVLGKSECLDPLLQILNSTPAGLDLVNEASEVDYRQRALAAYALGLLGSQLSDVEEKQRIISGLVEVLDGPGFSTRDIKVACIKAFGLVQLPADALFEPIVKRGRLQAVEGPLLTRGDQLIYLVKFIQNWRNNHELVIAHVPGTLVRLLEGLPDDVYEVAKHFVAEPILEKIAKHANVRAEIEYDCVLALGQLGDADGDDIDKEIRKDLMRFQEKSNNRQARYLGAIALARIASRKGSGEKPWSATPDVLDYLRGRMRRGESRERPWIALAMGVAGRELNDAGQIFPEDIVKKVREACDKERSPIDIGAYVLSLGLLRDQDSLQILREKLELFSIDQQKGLVALSIGMGGHVKMMEEMEEIVRGARFHPELLELAAQGLALLGDAELLYVLLEMLDEAGSQASELTLVGALGFVGDRRALEPLLDILRDEDRTVGTRGAAAASLGSIAEKGLLPWREPLSVNVNYRSTTFTLGGDAATGVLGMF